MATHEVDQKLLGHLASSYQRHYPKLAGTLFQILGLSIMLGPRVGSARRLRGEDLAKMEQRTKRRLLEEIVWLTRAGMELVQEHLTPDVSSKSDPRLRIFTAKLRASFYHVLCLFRNDRPITELAHSVLRDYESQRKSKDSSPLTPKSGNGRTSPSRRHSKGKSREGTRFEDKDNPTSSSPPDRRGVRESMLSEASMITNPWASISPAPPPGLSLPDVPANLNFLLPSMDYLPVAKGSFNDATKLATQLLPASSPLRLSVALEHCAFLWDCVHAREDSRKLARMTIRDVYRTDAGLTDEEFEDATTIVGTLGRMMRRKSTEGTPRFGSATPTAPPAEGFVATSADVPPVPRQSTRTERTSQAPSTSSTTAASASNTSPPRPKTSRGPPNPTTPPRTAPPDKPLPRVPTTSQSQSRSSPPRTDTRQSPPESAGRTGRTSQEGSSGSGTFKISRRPVPAPAPAPVFVPVLGSSTSPGRSRSATSETGSPGRSSTAPTATSTPRPGGTQTSPSRTNKRPGSDTESPTRRARTKRNGRKG